MIAAGVFAWVAAGTAAAGASSSRAAAHTVGARAQLVGHVTSAANSSGVALTGADIMAAIVGVLALGALAFLVVTFVTHRRARLA